MRRAKRKISLQRLSVRRKPGEPTRGILRAGASDAAGGAWPRRHQGQQARRRRRNAARRFRLKRLWWRADRHPRPATHLPVRRISGADGWCEDPADRRYNRPVKLPPSAKADRLARQDALYDFIVEIDHNTRPRIAGRGSAVFIHVARPGFRADRGLRRARHAGAAAAVGAPRRAHHIMVE